MSRGREEDAQGREQREGGAPGRMPPSLWGCDTQRGLSTEMFT